MGINWQMGVSDPMQGINSGLANLGQALQYQKQQERLAAQDKRQSSLADLQMQSQRMALAKGQRDLTNQNDLQALIQSQNGRMVPGSTTSVQPQAALPPQSTGLASLDNTVLPAQRYGQAPDGLTNDMQAAGLADPAAGFNMGQQPVAQIPQTAQQPMSERAKALETQNFLKERGMFDHLKELSTATNLTDKIDARQREQMAHVQAYGQMGYLQAKNSGMDEQAASAAGAKAAMERAQALGLPTTGMETAHYGNNFSFNSLPDGGYAMTSFDKNGSLEVKHIAPVKDTEGLLDKRLAAQAADRSAKKRQTGGVGTDGGQSGPLNGSGVNEGALQGLNPGQAALVKKMANYEIPLPTSRTKENLALMGRVALYDPNFDQQQYPIRQALRKSFTSGPDAKNITSLNTAVHHLDQLNDTVDKLGNRSNQYWNAIANKYETATGDPKFTKVINDLNAVKAELSTTFKGTGATDQEISAWASGFNPNGSPEQLKDAGVKEATKLLQGRLDALIDKYQTGMGTTKDLQILSAKSLETLKKLGVETDRYIAYAKGGSAGTHSASAATSAPKTASDYLNKWK